MEKTEILLKVYKASSSLIVTIVLSSCLLFQWPLSMTILALLATSVISAPALVSVQIMIWLWQRNYSFAWNVQQLFWNNQTCGLCL